MMSDTYINLTTDQDYLTSVSERCFETRSVKKANAPRCRPEFRAWILEWSRSGDADWS